MLYELEDIYNICNFNQSYQHSHQNLELKKKIVTNFQNLTSKLFVRKSIVCYLFILNRIDVIL